MSTSYVTLNLSFEEALSTVRDLNTDLTSLPGYADALRGTQANLPKQASFGTLKPIEFAQRLIKRFSMTTMDTNLQKSRRVDVVTPSGTYTCLAAEVQRQSESFILAPDGKYVIVAPHYFLGAIRNPSVTVNEIEIPYIPMLGSIRGRHSANAFCPIKGIDYKSHGFTTSGWNYYDDTFEDKELDEALAELTSAKDSGSWVVIEVKV